jgi:5'-nucleotidase
VYELDPFGNELVVTKLTGEEVLSLLKAAWPVDDKSPVYPSGITIKVKVNQDRDLEELTVMTENGEPLDKNRVYSVAMNSYMTQVYNYQHSDPGQSLFFTTAQALINFLKEQKEIRSYRGEKRIMAETPAQEL